MPMKTFVLACVASLLVSANLWAGTIHKWVDESGKVHYGDYPPHSAKSKQLELKNTSPSISKTGSSGNRQVETSQKISNHKWNYALQDALLRAVEAGDRKTVINLVSKKAYYNEDAVRNAIIGGYLAILEALLEGDGDIDPYYLDNKIIHTAVYHDRDMIVEYLADRGVDLNKAELSGQTPFILAIEKKYYDTLKVLLDQGVDFREEGTKAMRIAAQNGDKRLLMMLIEHGAEIDATYDDKRDTTNRGLWTPLMIASGKGYVELVKILIGHGADVNFRAFGTSGSSPLGLAKASHHDEVVEILKAAGATR